MEAIDCPLCGKNGGDRTKPCSVECFVRAGGEADDYDVFVKENAKRLAAAHAGSDVGVYDWVEARIAFEAGKIPVKGRSRTGDTRIRGGVVWPAKTWLTRLLRQDQVDEIQKDQHVDLVLLPSGTDVSGAPVDPEQIAMAAGERARAASARADTLEATAKLLTEENAKLGAMHDELATALATEESKRRDVLEALRLAKADHRKAIADLEAKHAAEIESLKAEHAKELDAATAPPPPPPAKANEAKAETKEAKSAK